MDPVQSPVTVLELVADRASVRGHSPAILAPARPPLTYQALGNEVARAGAALAALGIGRDIRVALALANDPEAAVAILSVIAWATAVPLNPALDRATCDLLLANLRVDVLIAPLGQNCAAVVAARARGLPVVRLSPRAGAAAGMFDLCAESTRAAVPRVRPDARDIALLLHTSGTTARPKAVPLSHAQILARSRSQPIDGADRCLCVAPLFTASALGHSLLVPLVAGAAIGFPRDCAADSIIEALAVLGTTYFSASPTVLSTVIDALGRRTPVSLPSLRFVRSSSSALPAALQHRIEAALGVPVVQGYGMTEVGTIAQNPLPPAPRKPGSVGLSVGPHIAIIDEQGRFCPRRTVGDVVVRGPGLMSGYADDAEATLAAFHDGWFRTGDTGYLDPDGYLFLSGRTKEIVNRGGLKFAPAEVDELLLRHPEVREAAAFAVAHPTLGEDLAAAVVLNEHASTTAEQLREFALAHLAPYKVPTTVVLVDSLARNALGKVSRAELAKALGPSLRHDFVLPRTASEEHVAAIFADTLNIGHIGAHDNFFALGGDSLSGMQAIARVNAELGSNLAPESLFRWPTVAQLSSHLADGAKAGSAPAPPIIARRERIRRPPEDGNHGR